MSARTGTAKQGRKSSMTMADLEAIHDNDKNNQHQHQHNNNHHQQQHNQQQPEKSISEKNSEIFEEMCYDAAHDDTYVKPPPFKPFNRRGSLTGCADDIVVHAATPKRIKAINRRGSMSSAVTNTRAAERQTLHTRRHSSYESTMRASHREQHAEIQEHFARLESKNHLRRSSFVSSLLEFNLSVDVSRSSDLLNSTSAAMQLSCPVLSYMNDDEEDSVELRQCKRHSLVSVMEDPNAPVGTVVAAPEKWETLQDGNDVLQESSSTAVDEYDFVLKPLEPQKTRPRRRRRHSYQVLEKQLAEQSPLDVFKGWSNSMNAIQHNDMTATTTTITKQPKSLQVTNNNHEFQRTGAITRTTVPCARGA